MIKFSNGQFRRILKYNEGISIRTKFLKLFNDITKKTLGPIYNIIDHEKVNKMNINFYEGIFQKYLTNNGYVCFTNEEIFSTYTMTYGSNFIINPPKIPILNILGNYGHTIFNTYYSYDLDRNGCAIFENALKNNIKSLQNDGINLLKKMQTKIN